MRYLCTIVIMILFGPTGIRSQNLPSSISGWVNRLSVQSSVLPQEQTFVHLDNTGYYKGDTLYYKAYVTRSDTGCPSDMSRVLYVELLDDDGYLIERQILRLSDGEAHGCFCLSDTLYGGYYELRAYTRWQLNFGVFAHRHSVRTKSWFLNESLHEEYFRDYDKLYSRVFPLYDKPSVPGHFGYDMSMRPLHRYYKTKREVPKAVVRLYPEGGSWVGGLPQRLAFEAGTPEGEHLNGTLSVLGSDGREIARGTTEHRGRGVITLTGSSSEKYRAVFRWAGNNESEVTLPDMESEGVVLKVEQSSGNLLLHASAIGRPARDTLAYTVLHNGRLTRHGLITETRTLIPLDSLPCGVAQVTVFDRHGQVWADRLSFIRHAGLPVAGVSIDGIPDTCRPYERIDLDIHSLPHATLSLAVRDRSHSLPTYDSGTLLTEMLLSSQIKGFVENPGYYFEADDSIHRLHADLLMMVQGWRRYVWHDMTRPVYLYHRVEKSRYLKGNVFKVDMPLKKKFDPVGIDSATWLGTRAKIEESLLENPNGPLNGADRVFVIPSDGSKPRNLREGLSIQNHGSGPITMTGSFHCFRADPYFYSDDVGGSRLNTGLKREVAVHAEFNQPGSHPLLSEGTTQEGKFTLTLPDFDGYCTMHLAASDTTKWKKSSRRHARREASKSWISCDNEYNIWEIPEFYVRLSFPYPRFVKPYSFYHTARPPLGQAGSVSGSSYKDGEGTTHMKEFTVKVRHGHNGLRGFDRTSPAFKLDAYEALNAVADAGMHTPMLYHDITFDLAVAANYVGEMGVGERGYTMIPRWDYYDDSHAMGALTHFFYRQLCCLDSVYVYTDYSPRKEGDEKYSQAFQPTVTVDLHRIPDDGRRPAFRDRFYILPGYNVCEDFYHPDYSGRRLDENPEDYRRTLYWNPDVRLDADGHASISFYNNSRHSQLSVSAEGISANGIIMSKK